MWWPAEVNFSGKKTTLFVFGEDSKKKKTISQTHHLTEGKGNPYPL